MLSELELMSYGTLIILKQIWLVPEENVEEDKHYSICSYCGKHFLIPENSFVDWVGSSSFDKMHYCCEECLNTKFPELIPTMNGSLEEQDVDEVSNQMRNMITEVLGK
mgnify:CR=1 FL=1